MSFGAFFFFVWDGSYLLALILVAGMFQYTTFFAHSASFYLPLITLRYIPSHAIWKSNHVTVIMFTGLLWI